MTTIGRHSRHDRQHAGSVKITHFLRDDEGSAAGCVDPTLLLTSTIHAGRNFAAKLRYHAWIWCWSAWCPGRVLFGFMFFSREQSCARNRSGSQSVQVHTSNTCVDHNVLSRSLTHV